MDKTNNMKPLKQKKSQQVRRIDVFIFGCGIVGGSLIEQIREQQVNLLDSGEIEITVFGIANSAQLSIDDNGIDLSQWKTKLLTSSDAYEFDKLLTFIKKNDLPNPVIIDCTGSKKIAMQYLDFFENGIHVVTANKIANGESIDYYHQIRRVAATHNKSFQYETNIGAGLPVIEPLQKLLKSGDRLERFEGILSGSLSYIFGELHKGLTLSQATIKAKDLGYTEPDPREDLNGMDVARKVLIIARETGMNIDLADIQVDSVLPDSFSDLSSAEAFMSKLPELDEKFSQRVELVEKSHEVLRYVASIKDGRCKVSIVAVNENNPLHAIDDGENVLAFYTRYYQPKPLVIRGYGAGPVVTAAGVFSDLLRIVD